MSPIIDRKPPRFVDLVERCITAESLLPIKARNHTGPRFQRGPDCISRIDPAQCQSI